MCSLSCPFDGGHLTVSESSSYRHRPWPIGGDVLGGFAMKRHTQMNCEQCCLALGHWLRHGIPSGSGLGEASTREGGISGRSVTNLQDSLRQPCFYIPPKFRHSDAFWYVLKQSNLHDKKRSKREPHCRHRTCSLLR